MFVCSFTYLWVAAGGLSFKKLLNCYTVPGYDGLQQHKQPPLWPVGWGNDSTATCSGAQNIYEYHGKEQHFPSMTLFCTRNVISYTGIDQIGGKQKWTYFRIRWFCIRRGLFAMTRGYCLLILAICSDASRRGKKKQVGCEIFLYITLAHSDKISPCLPLSFN